MADTDAPRKRGRHVEAARNDRVLLDAARDVFASQGFDAPVSAVAARAGVGIGSLYRRYATKEQLLQHLCLLAMEQTTEAATAALDHPDPWSGLVGYVHRCVADRTGSLGPVAGTIEVTPEMWEVAVRGQRLADDVVARAAAAGALREGVTTLDVSLLIEQVSRRSTTMDPDEEDNARDRLLAIALDGLRSRNTGPLPGRPPSRERYFDRWQKR